MNPSPSRAAAALAAIVIAVGFLAGCASATSGTATPASAAAAAQPSTVILDCSGQRQTRPSSLILTCADANDALTALHWASWATGQAFGTGTEKVDACTPDCADGKFVSYPALITLWRPEPLPGHPGVRYFTRITRIYPAEPPAPLQLPGQAHLLPADQHVRPPRNPHLAARPAPMRRTARRAHRCRGPRPLPDESPQQHH